MRRSLQLNVNFRVCKLRLQTGVQYLATLSHNARAEIFKTSGEAPQDVQVSFCIKEFLFCSLSAVFSSCYRYVKVLFRYIPR